MHKSKFAFLSVEAQKEHILDLAHEILRKYPFELQSIELINYEFNATYKVQTSDGQKYSLRINVNSDRTYENLLGEIAFVDFLNSKSVVNLPKPVPTKLNQLAQTIHSPLMERDLGVVLYTWLEGEELGDEPSEDSLRKLGAAMAAMHQATSGFRLPEGAKLPFLRDFLWETQNIIFSSNSPLSSEEKEILSKAKSKIELIIGDLYSKGEAIVIHADLHGGNVFSHEDEVFLFDFDDSGIGLPIQDLATALYYLDTPEQDAAMLDGYRSVCDLPVHSEYQLQGLLLQRRIILLNYLFETTNQEHQEMAPEYLVETIRRVKVFLEQK
jgi:Ser/Thr protein kinase RdoA (MazF antagonist)